MTGADEAIEAGAAAWQRINENGRRAWSDWILVGQALIVGRSKAMQEAKINRPFGSTYVRLFGAWLRDHGLDGIDTQQRYRCILCVENLQRIEEWRSTLDEKKRNALNHPGAIWAHWRRSLKATAPAPQRQHIVKRIAAAGDTARQGRAIYWPQECLRRGHEAMLKCRSNDLLKLCRVALEAAIRDQADLLALLPADPPTTSTSRSSVENNGAQAAEIAHASV
jgi:hypothetical protein